MQSEITERLKYDPFEVKQTFSDLNIRLHCCRYCMIMEWELENLSSPFWRLYYNSIGKAAVKYNNQITYLESDRIVIIPPNTPFSASLKGLPTKNIEHKNIRQNIFSLEEITNSSRKDVADHLFIHFNLGILHDFPEPGIYAFPVGEKESELLTEIIHFYIRGGNTFDFNISTTIYSLILLLLQKMPKNKWTMPKLDRRIMNTLVHIDQNLNKRLTNELLSSKGNMAKNAFARLFKENVGLSIQQYIKKKRIDQALILMQHSDVSIDKIADDCGFSDRHHFSKMFKEVMGISPVTYRKKNLYANPSTSAP